MEYLDGFDIIIALVVKYASKNCAMCEDCLKVDDYLKE